FYGYRVTQEQMEKSKATSHTNKLTSTASFTLFTTAQSHQRVSTKQKPMLLYQE
ncbi:hypothetical protein GOODEAATRI_020236, partial [Goodea atripinnis]